MTAETTTTTPKKSEWLPTVARYREPIASRSVWQLITTFIPFIGLMVLMYWSLRWSYALTLLLAVPTAGFAVRLFVLSHDCGHGALFKSKRRNDFWGGLAAFAVWTPYGYWRGEHARHHATSGNLDHRGIGDIWTLTVKEYQARNWLGRLGYRIYRHPLMLFGLFPFFVFTGKYRFWHKWAGPAEKRSIILTNLGLVAVLTLAHFTIGLKAFFLIEIPVTALAASAGVWLFYVQHQFEEVYWEDSAKWDFFRQAVEGSSCYRLPRILQWFSGSIGYHHIHHLSPKIPNYRLEPCHSENPLFHSVTELSFRESLKSLHFRLWDEDSRKMISFAALRKRATAKNEDGQRVSARNHSAEPA